MPTLVKSKSKKRVETDDETDTPTKAEPKVVVSAELRTLVKDWDKAEKNAGGYWVKIAVHISENEVSRAELKEALKTIRKMQELTANNEVSKLFKMKDHPDVLEQLVNNEITVREAREMVTTKQEGTDDPETKLMKSLKRAATFAIKEADVELADFVATAKSAYKDANSRIESAAKRAAANGGGDDEDEGEDEEEEDE